MKQSGIVISALLAGLFVGCSDGQFNVQEKKGSSSPSPTPSGQPVNSLAHKPQECPVIVGRYYLETDNSLVKDVRTVKSEDGVVLVDNGKEWIVDGQKHAIPNSELSYSVTCDKQELNYQVFYQGQFYGETLYRLNDKMDLEIETTGDSTSKADSRRKEIWVSKDII